MGHFLAGLNDAPRKHKLSWFQVAAMAAIPLAAILFQVYVARFWRFLEYLEPPLLVTLYFSLTWRSPVAGVFFGAGIGLAQDSLSPGLLGMYGIVKTLVGYFAASFSHRFAVDNAVVRLVLAFFFYFFHQFLYWVLARALLGQALDFEAQQTMVMGMLNAAVAAPLFHLLDKLKLTG
jgi:rod shape-determining protein MreD